MPSTYRDCTIVETNEHASVIRRVVETTGYRRQKVANTWPILARVPSLPDAYWPTSKQTIRPLKGKIVLMKSKAKKKINKRWTTAGNALSLKYVSKTQRHPQYHSEPIITEAACIHTRSFFFSLSFLFFSFL